MCHYVSDKRCARKCTKSGRKVDWKEGSGKRKVKEGKREGMEEEKMKGREESRPTVISKSRRLCYVQGRSCNIDNKTLGYRRDFETTHSYRTRISSCCVVL